MSITTPPTWSFPPPGYPLRPFTVDEYERMIRAGILTKDDHVELLEGWIVPKMSRNPPHDVSLDKWQEALRNRLKPNWRVRLQSAITTSDSEPEPDIGMGCKNGKWARSWALLFLCLDSGLGAKHIHLD